MSDKRQAGQVKAILYFVTAAVAIIGLSACGGSSSGDDVSRVSSAAILDNVQAELSEAGIVVVDSDPQVDPPIGLDDAAAPFAEYDAVPISCALVRVDTFPTLDPLLQPDPYQEMLVWAIRVDTRESTEDLLPRDAATVVGLVSAEDGTLKTVVSR
jgi:hypothetical protein